MFYPSIGGLEMMVSILADEFVRQGHEVKLVCRIPATDSKKFPFEVFRRPNPWQLLKLTRWCDVFFQANISLKGIWPLLIVRKPLAVSHQGLYARSDGRIGWQDHLKRRATRFAHNISASHIVADNISSRSTIIPNSYRDDIFQIVAGIPRTKQLVFLGRLVSEKGADLLLAALAQLKYQGLYPQLTIIGGGPEESNLKQQAKELSLDAQIEFTGLKTGAELTRTLNEHQIMVVPSRCKEGFGIVALEGIACGCVVVGSDGGGLKDAIGPCGVTFTNGDVKALTEILSDLLTNSSKLVAYHAEAKVHLARHRIDKVVKSYLQVFERAVKV
jgi:glycosyltransferase involved in cell wall biosynthesis